MKNFVKEKLRAGKPSIGTWVEMNNPDVSEQLSVLGFDWLVFDVEHGLFTMPDIQRMMQSMNHSLGCLPFVRVPINEPVFFKWALDMGACGVVVPWVNSKEDATKAVRASKYPPEGNRGCGPRRASQYYSGISDYVKSANEEILVVVMIESQEALDNLDEILSVKGVDAAFIGPDDLSLNLGIFQEKQHSKFKASLVNVVDACKKHGIAPGMHCNDKNINEAISQGFQFCALNDDDTFLTMGAKACLQGVRGWVPDNHSR
ncbi:MAG TPA: aldolase/citrate lyase family protein [Candidatus Bathyarchaeia archaeon]|nr:aldolase/citrate lyase family protein [Candidatus Bathyarchaeia archaeon]